MFLRNLLFDKLAYRCNKTAGCILNFVPHISHHSLVKDDLKLHRKAKGAFQCLHDLKACLVKGQLICLNVFGIANQIFGHWFHG